MVERSDGGTGPLQLLWEADGPASPEAGSWRGAGMPGSLRERYGGPLGVGLDPERPAVISNFVSTIDGVVALDAHGASGGSEISGSSRADRFVMALLRALVDAVLVGSGTVRAAPGHRWTADHVDPADSSVLAAWRTALGLSANPTTVVVTASGLVDPGHPGLADPAIPVILATTREGAARAREGGFGTHVEIVALGDGTLSPGEILTTLGARGMRLVLCEGGPHLMAQLAAAGLVDELFLTLAPQLVGRAPAVERLALLEGTALAPGGGWCRLRSVRRADQHLFLRYAVTA